MTTDSGPSLRRPRRTLTIRQLLLLIAGIALFLAARRQIAPTPEEWARDQAAEWEEMARESRRYLADHPEEAGRLSSHHPATEDKIARDYARLATIFARDPVPWGEATGHGPFTSQLAVGQQVVTRCEAPAARSELAPAGGGPDRVAAGTACVVLRDWAVDDDDCNNFRPIDVQLLAGPDRGAVVSIGRECLRRP